MTPNWIPIDNRRKPIPFDTILVWLDGPNRFYATAGWWDSVHCTWHVVNSKPNAASYITHWADTQPPLEEQPVTTQYERLNDLITALQSKAYRARQTARLGIDGVGRPTENAWLRGKADGMMWAATNLRAIMVLGDDPAPDEKPDDYRWHINLRLVDLIDGNTAGVFIRAGFPTLADLREAIIDRDLTQWHDDTYSIRYKRIPYAGPGRWATILGAMLILGFDSSKYIKGKGE